MVAALKVADSGDAGHFDQVFLALAVASRQPGVIDLASKGALAWQMFWRDEEGLAVPEAPSGGFVSARAKA